MASEICLTCLCKPEKAHNLNDILLENLKVWEMLHQFVPVGLDKQDFTYPDSICAKCLEKLVMSYKFKKQCLDALQSLQKMSLDKSSKNVFQQQLSERKLKAQNFELEINENMNNDESTMESPPDTKQNLKMAFDESITDTLKDNIYTDVEMSLSQDDNIDQMENGDDKSNVKLQSKRSSIKSFQEKACSENTMDASVVPNQCKLCNKKFKVPQGLASHMSKTHFKKHLYQCQKCDKGFSVEELFIRHFNRHLGIKPFPCTQCDKAFDTNSILNKHLLCHSKESALCKKLQQIVHIDKQSTESDNQSNAMKKRAMCKRKGQFCELEGETSIDSLNESEEESKEIKEKFKVQIEENEESGTEMEYPVQSKTLLDDIKEQENNNKSTKCDLCNQIFKNSHGLARHRSSTHFKIHLYQCDKCDRGFSVEEHYIKHRNRHLGIKDFKCNQCDKAFETNSILNQHLISHSNLTPHLCSICGKSFRRPDGLRQHMKRHGDERSFKCSICSKTFKCLSDNLKHMNIHDGKRYACNICGTRLATTESLRQHQMIHTGQKPFKCSHCDKSFISLSNLKCHERIHTGEKPYKCQYCLKSFRQSNDRNKHARRMHKNEIGNTKFEQN